MSSRHGEVEGRLDDMLTRIAMETQEIKELEQQLTDGQILVNEVLQRDLEGIIFSLQEYLRGLREQARRTQQQVHSLQDENQNLKRHLEDTQRHCGQLDDTQRQCGQLEDTQRHCVRLEDTQRHCGRLDDTQRQCGRLEDTQRHCGRLEDTQRHCGRLEDNQRHCGRLEDTQRHCGRLEDNQRHCGRLEDTQRHCGQLDDTQRQCGQLEDNQRHCGRLEDTQRHCGRLEDTVEVPALRDRQVEAALQDEKLSLQQIVHRLQAQLDQNSALYEDQAAAAALLDPQEAQDEDSPENMLCKSMEQLHRTSREQLQRDLNASREQIARLQAQLAQEQDRRDQLQSHLETQVVQEQDWVSQSVEQDEESEGWRLKEDIQRFRDKLQRSRSRYRHIQQNLESALEQRALQLHDVQQQRDALLQQLHSQSKEHQRNLRYLNRKLQQLGRSMCDSDQLTAEQLRRAIKQLRALNQTVELLHTQKKTRDRGQCCYVAPGHSVPSFGSQGTQDSGLGLQYLNSPARGQQQDRPPPGGGNWVSAPPTHTDTGTADWTDSDTDQRSRGGTPSPAAAHPPLVQPAWLLCGSPAAAVYGPPAGGSEHSLPQGLECECVLREAERLKKKKKPQVETKKVQDTLRHSAHRSVMQVCNEVDCVEETLLRRRAELRQADRLLLEAQSCIRTTREQVTSVQREADLLQHSAQDSATYLLETTEHIRELQEEVEDLRRRRQEEENSLREVKEAQKSRDQELQQLRTHSATQRLSGLLSDCQEAQRCLELVNSQVEQQEQRLVQRTDEHQTAVKRVSEVRHEGEQLQNTIKGLLEQQEMLTVKMSTISALKEEEQKLLRLQSEVSAHRAELKQVLQELLGEQQVLQETKNKHTQTLQQLQKKKDELDRTKDKADRKRDELNRIQDEVKKRKDMVETQQQELDRKMDEMDRLQDEVERKRKELAGLQQEVESHRKEAELCLQNTTMLQTETQEELSRRREEKSSLKEQCKHLEARRTHAQRCLSAGEAELAKQKEQLSYAHLLNQQVVRETAANQEQLKESSELLSELSERVEKKKKELQTLEEELSVSRQRTQTQTQLEDELQLRQVLKDIKAAVCRLEDRGRHLDKQQLQLSFLGEELKQQREGHMSEEGLNQMEAGPQKKCDDLLEEQGHSTEAESEEDESFYLSTVRLSSPINTEARLRLRLWNQQENLRQLETEETLTGLRLRLDQLDSLLTNMELRSGQAQHETPGTKHQDQDQD
ncbi:centriolin-like isoform X4 [Echeneis naucrates]|uniref:centriolin-like isoform X4 n=1 Tax=Echeneis naucrates TaxID=173247 RepID=UPI00111440D0|nr:centriolin-like isoform X4 [Echeneis naucrates]